MLSKRRFILALGVSPMVPLVLCFLLVVVILGGFARHGDIARLALHMLGVAPHSYVVGLSLGALTAFALSKLQRLTVPYILLCSCAFGVLTGIAYDLLVYWPRTQEIMSAVPESAVLGGIAGLLVSGAFLGICGTKFRDLPVKWRHVLPVLAVVDAAWLGWLGWQAVELRRFEARVSATTSGMSQDEVVALLGEPNADSPGCSHYIKPQPNCSTTLNYQGPLGSGAVFFLDADGRVIGAMKPR